MGAMSLRFSGPLADALRDAQHGARAASAVIGAGMLLFARTPVDGSYVVDVLPAMVLVGLGAGLGFPGADDARDVGRRAAGRRPGLRPGQHQRAGRRRDRPRRAGDARERAHRRAGRRRPAHAAALNSGFHLAYLIGAGVLAAAVIVALAHAPRAEGCPGPGRGPQAGPAPQQPSGLLRGLTRMATDPEIRELSPQPAVTEVAVTDADGIPSVVDAAFPRLFGRLAELGVEPAGPPFIRYLRTGAELELELGIPVGPDAGQSSGLPGGRAAVLRHVGPFSGLRDACDAAAGVGGERGGRAVLGVLRDEPARGAGFVAVDHGDLSAAAVSGANVNGWH